MLNDSRAQSPPTARVFAVLEALAEPSSGGLSLSEIARKAALNTSTTASILATMHGAGYVERLPNRAYLLGPGLLKLLAGLRSRYPLLGAADEELSRLSAVADCGCTLSRVSPDDLEVILTVGAVDEFVTRVGHRVPIHPPYGIVAVAWRSADSITEWLSTAPELSARDEDELRVTLAEVNERGYAVYSIKQDVQTMVGQVRQLLGQVDDHVPTEMLRRLLLASVEGVTIYTTAELADRRRRPVSYVIAPVFGADQQPRYLVSLHIMRGAVPATELDRYVDALRQTAAALTKIAGGNWPNDE